MIRLAAARIMYDDPNICGRGVARKLIGGVYLFIQVDQFEFDLKETRQAEYQYMNINPLCLNYRSSYRPVQGRRSHGGSFALRS